MPAPGGTEPADGVELYAGNPRFAWSDVQSAKSYVIEICKDPSCGETVDPPIIEWKLGGAEMLASFSHSSTGKAKKRRGKGKAKGHPVLQWSTDGKVWSSALISREKDGPFLASPSSKRWSIRSNDPNVLLRATRTALFAEDSGMTIGPETLVHISARDSGCGVERLDISYSEGNLLIEAFDLLGNRASEAWPFREGVVESP